MSDSPGPNTPRRLTPRSMILWGDWHARRERYHGESDCPFKCRVWQDQVRWGRVHPAGQQGGAPAHLLPHFPPRPDPQRGGEGRRRGGLPGLWWTEPAADAPRRVQPDLCVPRRAGLRGGLAGGSLRHVNLPGVCLYFLHCYCINMSMLHKNKT